MQPHDNRYPPSLPMMTNTAGPEETRRDPLAGRPGFQVLQTLRGGLLVLMLLPFIVGIPYLSITTTECSGGWSMCHKSEITHTETTKTYSAMQLIDNGDYGTLFALGFAALMVLLVAADHAARRPFSLWLAITVIPTYVAMQVGAFDLDLFDSTSKSPLLGQTMFELSALAFLLLTAITGFIAFFRRRRQRLLPAPPPYPPYPRFPGYPPYPGYPPRPAPHRA